MMELFSSYSSFSVLLVFFWYVLLVLPRANTLQRVDHRCKMDYWGIFLIFLICLFPFQAKDYYHYMEALSSIRMGYGTNLEDFYIRVADFVDYNYFVFRFIVWGGAILLFYLAIVVLNLPPRTTLTFLLCVFILRFSYARVSLAMACGIFGYAMLITSRLKDILIIILSLVVIYISTIFHKSAIFWFPVVIASLFDLNRIRLLILLLMYPLLVYLLQAYGIIYLLSGEEDSVLRTSAQYYISSEKKNYGIGSGLRIVLMRAPYYIFLGMFFLSVIKGRYRLLASVERRILNISFYIVYISTLFAFTFTMNTEVLYYRLLFFAMLPITLSLSIFKTYNLYRNGIFAMVLVGVVSCIYELLYAAYITQHQ